MLLQSMASLHRQGDQDAAGPKPHHLQQRQRRVLESSQRKSGLLPAGNAARQVCDGIGQDRELLRLGPAVSLRQRTGPVIGLGNA
jgi:hypothetical protein